MFFPLIISQPTVFFNPAFRRHAPTDAAYAVRCNRNIPSFLDCSQFKGHEKKNLS